MEAFAVPPANNMEAFAVPQANNMEAFAVPQANNMEAIWAVKLLRATLGKLYNRLSTKKSAWRAYLMGHAEKTLGSIHVGITLQRRV